MKPVIFLDIDGVLCTTRACARTMGFMQTYDPVGSAMLEVLLKASGANLVLSSTWRHHHDRTAMTGFLQNAGLQITIPWHTCWKTPTVTPGPRGGEIQRWFETNGKPDRYLILDDDNDFLDEQRPFFVRTHVDDGISWDHFMRAAQILGVEKRLWEFQPAFKSHARKLIDPTRASLEPDGGVG